MVSDLHFVSMLCGIGIMPNQHINLIKILRESMAAMVILVFSDVRIQRGCGGSSPKHK